MSDLLPVSDPTTDPSFTFANRVRRGLWHIVWLLAFRPSPRFLHEYRSWILRLFGASVGRNVHVYPSVRVWAPWNLSIGNNVGIGERCILYSMGSISIGERTVISQGSHLCAGTHDYNDTHFRLLLKPITVARNVWICAEAFIGPGTSIADGCVVGARGVVTKNLEIDYGIYAGNPAQLIGRRKQTTNSTKEN